MIGNNSSVEIPSSVVILFIQGVLSSSHDMLFTPIKILRIKNAPLNTFLYMNMRFQLA